MKIDLLTNAKVVDDPIRFVTDKQQQHKQMTKRILL